MTNPNIIPPASGQWQPFEPRAWTAADGARLRRLREAKGLDVAALALRLTLSVAQLRQLENNEASLFYSEPIRLAAARKVTDFLGVPLFEEETLPAPSGALDQPAPSATAAPLAFDSEVNMQRTGWLPKPQRKVAGLALGLVLALGMVFGAARWLMPSRSAPAPAVATPAPVAPPSPVAIAPVDSPPTAAAQNEPTVECGPTQTTASIYRSPSQAVKDPALLYVVGKPGQVICVTDARGTQWRHAFREAIGQSFYGQAPWMLASAELGALEIFFQGRRARPPDPTSTHLRLLPHLAPP